MNSITTDFLKVFRNRIVQIGILAFMDLLLDFAEVIPNEFPFYRFINVVANALLCLAILNAIWNYDSPTIGGITQVKVIGKWLMSIAMVILCGLSIGLQ